MLWLSFPASHLIFCLFVWGFLKDENCESWHITYFLRAETWASQCFMFSNVAGNSEEGSRINPSVYQFQTQVGLKNKQLEVGIFDEVSAVDFENLFW